MFKSWGILTTIIENADFYGIYHSNKDNFKFSSGERVLITELKKYIEERIKNESIKYFAPTNRRKTGKRNITDFSSTTEIPSVGLFYTHIKSTKSNQITTSDEELQKQLHSNLLSVYRSNGVQECSLNELTIDKISVTRDNDNRLHGFASCVLCTNTNAKKQIIPYKIEYNRVYWTLSNFQRHLVNAHTLKRLPKDNVPTNLLENIPDTESKEIETQRDVNETPTKSESNKFEEATNVLDELSEISHIIEKGENSQSLIKLEIGIASPIESHINDQISRQIAKMLPIFTANNNESKNTMSFEIADRTCVIEVAPTKKDGKCLFGALTHQLFGLKLASDTHEKATNKLRAEVVNFIGSNLPLFEHEIKGCIYHAKSKQNKINKNIGKKINNSRSVIELD